MKIHNCGYYRRRYSWYKEAAKRQFFEFVLICTIILGLTALSAYKLDERLQWKDCNIYGHTEYCEGGQK